MQIWRIEDENGNGPSQCGDFVVERLLEAAADNPDRSEDFPVNDSIPFNQVRFGFAGLETLIDWFTFDAIYRLLKLGYSLKNYQVPASRVVLSKSRTQLMFDKTAATFEYEITDARRLFHI